jgi:hypothetical protein
MQQGRGFHDLSQNTAEVTTPIHGADGLFLGFTCFRQRNIEMPKLHSRSGKISLR